MAAHDIEAQVRGVGYRDANFTLFVHNVDLEEWHKSVTLNHLPVVGRVVAVVLQVVGAAAVGGVALHNGTVHGHHQVLDKFGLKVVGVASFAGRNLHRHLAVGLHAKGFVDFYQRLRADVGGEVYGGTLLFIGG